MRPAPATGSAYVALLRRVVTQWRWLLGMLASLVGLGLHVVALHLGSLTLVQPLVVTGLFFSLVFRDCTRSPDADAAHAHLGRITAAGLALFLTAAGSTDGVPGTGRRPRRDGDRRGPRARGALVWTSSRLTHRRGC